MSETYFFIESTRYKNGYQWSGEKLIPIDTISSTGRDFDNEIEEMVELTGFAFHDYYKCWQPFYDLVTKLKTENKRSPYPLVHEEILDHVEVHKLIQSDKETEQQIKDNLLSIFNVTGVDYVLTRNNAAWVRDRTLTLGFLIHDFVDLHNAIAEREPFMPPSDWVQDRLNSYGFELVYRKNKYVPKFDNVHGAVWHSFVQNEWGFKPSNCKWCNTFLLAQRKGSIYCSEPRKCRFNASNYKISKQREEKRNANKKA